MKLCNDVITVFNARVDPEEGGNVWMPTVITGVSWWATDASTVDASKGGLVAANRVTVRIPADAIAEGKAYADPISYRNADSVADLWTLQNGDIIVRGDVSDTQTSSGSAGDAAILHGGEGWTPAKLRKAFAHCATIVGVTDNRRMAAAPLRLRAGLYASNAPHWKVTAT